MRPHPSPHFFNKRPHKIAVEAVPRSAVVVFNAIGHTGDLVETRDTFHRTIDFGHGE